MGFSFQRLVTGNTLLDQVQTNIVKAFNSVVGPFLGGNLLTGIAIGTTDTVINHGLARIPQIWVICDQNTNTSVWRVSWDENSITLVAGTACTVSLWVN